MKGNSNNLFNRIRKYLYPTLFLFAVIVFLIHYAISGQAVYGDGIGYYSHLHSWVIDGDWNYTNEYKHIFDHEHNNTDTNVESATIQIVSTTKDGKAENFYGTGVAVLLLPFYLLAHIISLCLNRFGFGLSAQGYGDVYQILSGIGAIFYCVTGVYFLEKIIFASTRKKEVSLISAFTIFLSTSLLYYGSFDVINSHFASFFLSTFFFYVFFQGKKVKSNLILGLIAGLLTITRIQDSVMVVIWTIAALHDTKTTIKSVLKFCIGFAFGIIPLMIHWSFMFGNPLNHTYIRGLLEKYEAKQSVDIWGSLFNPVTGLFFRTPLLLILFLYFFYLIWKRNVKIFFYPFLFLLMQFFIITAQGGWAAAAYGGRMYMSSLVFFGVLLGKLLLQLKKPVLIYLSVLFFIIINFVSMTYFILRDKGAEDESHGTEQRTIQRMQKLMGR